jgi:hypothetical protein
MTTAAEHARPCTCHPDEAPVPCPHKYALSECRNADPRATALTDLVRITDTQPTLRETIARAIESLTQEEIPSGRAMAAAERVVRAMGRMPDAR